ncbi:MAG: flagellar biosynthesis protein FlhA [bacterium]|jgi:flagellar biosynthesis protein FlhA
MEGRSIPAIGEFAGIAGSARRNIEMAVPLIFLASLLLMIIRFPPFMLDVFIAGSLIAAILVSVLTMYVREPLDFSIFPTVILLTSVYRLFLNVATTRAILSSANAGHVIQTFASYVVGDSYIVGIAIFAIIIIINFVVITFGAQRIGEVAARFTLDALPGKQISIDADLNAGIINEEQARARRKRLEDEADYFGAMDGASRFVQRDALATIILIFVNIIAGFAIGITQMGMTWQEALQTFTRLTIGDGLVASIPALLISTATGIMVTKSAAEETVGESVIGQLFAQARVMWIASGFLFVVSMVPGMPKIILWPAAGILAYLGWRVSQERKRKEEAGEIAIAPSAAAAAESPADRQRRQLEEMLQVDQLELEIGYALIPLVDAEQQGDLLERVNNIRRQIVNDLGFIVPPMRIRDNIALAPGGYVIKVKGTTVATGELQIDRFLAMNPRDPQAEFEGLKTKEPAFGIDAYWIETRDRARAEAAGFTVVDASTVLATHLTEVIKNYSAEILDRQAVKTLLDNLKERFPALVEDLVPGKLSIAQVHKVLQLLLRERVSIKNLAVICEALGDYATEVERNPEILTEYCRQALARQITAQHTGADGVLVVSTLDPAIEERIAANLQQTPSGTVPVLDLKYNKALMENVGKQIEKMVRAGNPPVFLVSPRVRPYFRKLVERTYTGVTVLSYLEVTKDAQLRTVGYVENPDAG